VGQAQRRPTNDERVKEKQEMSDYRRWFLAGGTYFFTVVTYNRQPILCDDLARDCLRKAIETVRKTRAIEIVAFVLQPNHLHAVWALPPGDGDYSTRWRRIKEEFTQAYLSRGGRELTISAPRARRAERGVWQRRFWEHSVRDEEDLKRCVDYVHWNPKKHGLVPNVRDWPWSSFHRYVAAGEYEVNWGATDPTPTYRDPEWGE
jgi:putative transposase